MLIWYEIHFMLVLIDFPNDLGNFKLKNFYISKCKFFYILQQQTLCCIVDMFNFQKVRDWRNNFTTYLTQSQL